MVESRGLERGYLDVQPGDCVVAFSRKDIYDIKQLIEAGTGQRWASMSHALHSDALGIDIASALSFTCALDQPRGSAGWVDAYRGRAVSDAQKCQISQWHDTMHTLGHNHQDEEASG